MSGFIAHDHRVMRRHCSPSPTETPQVRSSAVTDSITLFVSAAARARSQGAHQDQGREDSRGGHTPRVSHPTASDWGHARACTSRRAKDLRHSASRPRGPLLVSPFAAYRPGSGCAT